MPYRGDAAGSPKGERHREGGEGNGDDAPGAAGDPHDLRSFADRSVWVKDEMRTAAARSGSAGAGQQESRHARLVHSDVTDAVESESKRSRVLRPARDGRRAV